MTILNFINDMQTIYNIDVSKNIKYNIKNIVLYDNENFSFSRIFVSDLMQSGLYNMRDFMPIGTSEDNNIYILNSFYHYFSAYYAVYDFTKDTIVLYKR